ncbi:MAG: hypothetical protein HQL74_15030 [Magnetococcales bacterium]|nr:hypothetical protein [Magnetococcales bacterium]
MIVLGLHFGHDASISLLVDGVLIAFSEMERLYRVKHVQALTSQDILCFLNSNNLSLSDVDVCSIGSGEYNESGRGNPSRFLDFFGDMEIGNRDKILGFPCTKEIFSQQVFDRFKKLLPASLPHPSRIFFVDLMPYYEHINNKPISHDYIANSAVMVTGDELRTRMLQPARFSIAGRSPKRAFFVSHHAAHAQYAFSFSPYMRALIITIDGLFSSGFMGGGIYFGFGQNIFPQVAHYSPAGFIYAALGPLVLGPDGIDISTPGKLMGLSAYGFPVYSSDHYIKTGYEIDNDHSGAFTDATGNKSFKTPFLKSISRDFSGTMQELKKMWDMVSDPPEMHGNIASSIQDMFLRSVSKIVDSAVVFANRVGFTYDGICLSGGAFLNCPTNSLLYNKYHNIFIPPAVNDEGISLGAALMFDNGFKKQNVTPGIAYLGKKYDVDEFMRKFDEFSDELTVVAEGELAIHRLAQELHDGKTSGFFYGRAEIGPRALGHRSILAGTSDCQTSLHVNRIKDREKWRPFAPILTEEMLNKFFIGAPSDSYFMLFNAKVRNSCFAAVTHVDGTARVQVATPDCGPVYDLLKVFGSISGYEILLNTSFNGRGEPIVETPRDACQAFLRMPLDYLYLEGYLLIKKRRMNY